MQTITPKRTRKAKPVNYAKHLTIRVSDAEFNIIETQCKDRAAFFRLVINHYDEVSSFLNTLKK